MRTQPMSASTAPGALRPPSLPGWMEPDVAARGFPATGPDAPDHDASLIVAALEQLAMQRAAIEWLAEADLLRLCLV